MADSSTKGVEQYRDSQNRTQARPVGMEKDKVGVAEKQDRAREEMGKRGTAGAGKMPTPDTAAGETSMSPGYLRRMREWREASRSAPSPAPSPSPRGAAVKDMLTKRIE